MSWLLQRIVHNEAMRTDPPEIYGWRVYLLACSVCESLQVAESYAEHIIGLLRRHALWNGLGNHRWSSHDATFHAVGTPVQEILGKLI